MQQIRRKVRDVADARQLLAELKRSQLPLAEFARREGVDGRSTSSSSTPTPCPTLLASSRRRLPA